MERGEILGDPGDDGEPQLAVVLGDDRRPQLDDGDGHRRTLERGAGIELEDDPRDLYVVAGLESLLLERGDHAHPPQPVLDVGERLVVLEVVTGDQALDGVAGDAELARAGPLD